MALTLNPKLVWTQVHAFAEDEKDAEASDEETWADADVVGAFEAVLLLSYV